MPRAESRKLKAEDRRPKTQNQNGNGNGHAVSLANGVTVVQPEQIPVDAIGPSPYQPRQSFPEEEIRALADSIAAQGLIQPVVVRRRRLIDRLGVQSPDPKAQSPKPKAQSHEYELIDGERRWRAHQVLGLATIRAEVQERTDAEARAIVLASALQRKELNAIEQARAFQAILDAGDAPGPTELARTLGLSQGHVSNTLRLLRLPEAWRARVISGEIPAAHARAVVPFAEKPAVLRALDKRLKRFRDYSDGRSPTVEEFADEVTEAVGDVGRPITGPGRRFVPTEEQRANLEIVEIEEYGQQVEVALNAKLYDKLAKQHLEDLAARDEKRGGGEEGRGEKAQGPKPKTKAQVEEAKRHDAARRADQARLTARKVWSWRIDRLRAAIAAGLAELDAGDQARVIAYFVCSPDAWYLAGSAIWHHKHDREELAQFACRTDGGFSGKRLWPSLARLPAEKAAFRLVEIVRELVWSSQHGPQIPMPDDVVEAMAGQFHVDLAELWKGDQRGEAGRKYYELHTREQLVELGEELGAYLNPGLDKAGMISMLQAKIALKLPKELAKPKRV